MKKIKIIAVAIVAMLFVATPAQAQFRWGIKLGADFNKISLTDDSFFKDSSNRTGFTGGLMTEFQVPLIGLCFDASLMYTHKTTEIKENGDKDSFGTDYLSIPINLKYKFGLPIVGNLVAPYIFTGPEFAFRVSKEDFKNLVKNKTADISWNFGAGVQLLNHLQISAAYGLGVNKCASFTSNGQSTTGRNNTWTVTAAYLF